MKINKSFLVFFIFSTICATLFIIKNISKPYSLDEAQIALNSHHVMDRGFSAFGERVAPGSIMTKLQIPHPALHFGALALMFKIFGEVDWAGRFIGVLGILWTLFFFYKILRLYLNQTDSINAWLLTASLYVINPFILQYSLLIDIDPCLLGPLLTTCVYYFIRFEKEKQFKDLIWTSIWTFVAIWAKELTPLFFIMSVFVYYLIQKRWKEAFVNTVILFSISVIGFVITWLIFCYFTNTPVLAWVYHSFTNKGLSFSLLSHFSTIIMLIKLMVMWISPPIFLLFVISMTGWFQLKKPVTQQSHFFYFIYVFIFILYTWIYIPAMSNFYMLKYNFPIYPILFILLGLYLYKKISDNKISTIENVLISSGILISVGYYFIINLKDPVLLLHHGKLSILSTHMFLYMLPLLIFILIVKLIRKKSSWITALIISSIISGLSLNLFLNLKQLGNYTTAPSWHEYGQTGLGETIEYIAQRVSSKDKVMVRKDIAYYLNFRYGYAELEWFYPIFRGTENEILNDFTTVIEKYTVSYVTLDPTMNIAVSQKIIAPYFDLDQKFGDFYIYKRKTITEY